MTERTTPRAGSLHSAPATDRIEDLSEDTDNPASTQPAVETRGIVLGTGQPVPDFSAPKGLTLCHVSREASATVLALTLGGRMRPKRGDILLGAPTTARQRYRRVALAGVTAIDSLERLVSARTVVREQLAWSQPWWKLTARHPMRVAHVKRAFELVSLDMSDDDLRHTPVGKMEVLDRFKLRVALALIARPEAQILVVDDIDQLRSNRLRREFLQMLAQLSQTIPVIAVSANADTDGLADQVLRMTVGAQQAPANGSAEPREKEEV